ncbi:hypothetical protein CDL12_02055 [Handroanthus impetiginosus]|uniref:Uncharacterized protein n=1 Tax=Handroanthus impetiginosus TaxID=429701 RepID=A0A2G9I640_9LAMI|nr:hypothetical protein CDL12_02055 [Handroanthus impetiginosus]
MDTTATHHKHNYIRNLYSIFSTIGSVTQVLRLAICRILFFLLCVCVCVCGEIRFGNCYFSTSRSTISKIKFKYNN